MIFPIFFMKENKMTWVPKNRSAEDGSDRSGDEEDCDKQTEGNQNTSYPNSGLMIGKL